MAKVPSKNNKPNEGGVPSPYKDVAFEAFIEFMSLPDPDKALFMGMEINPVTKKFDHIPTQKEFAQKYGVARETLSVWKKRPDYIKRIDAQRKQWGMDKTSNVLAALYTRCIKYGMAYDVETYLAYYEGWTRTQVVKQVTDKFDVDDLRAIIAELPPDQQADAFNKLATIISAAEARRGNAEGEGSTASGSGNNTREIRS